MKNKQSTKLQIIGNQSQTIFLYCCPDCPSCPAHFNSIGWTAWAIQAVKKNYSLTCFSDAPDALSDDALSMAWRTADTQLSSYLLAYKVLWERMKKCHEKTHGRKKLYTVFNIKTMSVIKVFTIKMYYAHFAGSTLQCERLRSCTLKLPLVIMCERTTSHRTTDSMCSCY